MAEPVFVLRFPDISLLDSSINKKDLQLTISLKGKVADFRKISRDQTNLKMSEVEYRSSQTHFLIEVKHERKAIGYASVPAKKLRKSG